MSTPETDDRNIIDETQDLADAFERRSDLGAIQFAGPGGYHTYFRRSDGLDYALETALHAALDEALLEVALEPTLVEEYHGDVTPETATKTLRMMLEDFLGLHPTDPFVQRLTTAFRETLEKWDEQLGEEADDD